MNIHFSNIHKSHYIRNTINNLIIAMTLLLFSCTCLAAQPFDTFLKQLSQQSNPAKQDAMVNAYIKQSTNEQGGLPLIENKKGDKADVVFLYREQDPLLASESILWFGEFNGVSDNFGPKAYFMRDFVNDEALNQFPIPGYKTLYYRKLSSVPIDARLNYKFISLPIFSFIFDPLNPLVTPGGFGGDSVFKMPRYCDPKPFNYVNNIPHGTVYGANDVPLVPIAGSPVSDPTKDPSNVNKVLNAKTLYILPNSMRSIFVNTPNKDEGYWVYLPPGYDKGYPVIYMLDGYDFLSYSNINNIVDYMIAKGLIEPIILVLQDQQFCENSAGETFSNGQGGVNSKLCNYSKN